MTTSSLRSAVLLAATGVAVAVFCSVVLMVTSGVWVSMNTVPRLGPGRARVTPWSSRDELLSAIDVVGRARERGVDHQVNGERRDVGRAGRPARSGALRAAAEVDA